MSIQNKIFSTYVNMFNESTQQLIQQSSSQQQIVENTEQKTKYTVTVRRVSWASVDIQVQADSEKQAQQLALKEAVNTDFSDQDGFQYQIEDVTLS